MKEKTNLPPLKKFVELTEDQKLTVDRFKEELQYRLGTDISIEVYKLNYLAYPSQYGDSTTFEVKAGNWKRIAQISNVEMTTSYGQVFYYFMRRLVDDTMSDLLKRGATYF